MRASIRLATVASLAFAAAGCGPSIHVRTVVAPDVRLSSMHTFSMLPAPERRGNRAGWRIDDPMVSNSIAHKAIRNRIAQSLVERGYVVDDVHPDFAVAFYASSREKLILTDWDNGYPYYPPWTRPGRRHRTVTEYTEGTLIIDVIDPRSRELLWRGEGVAALSEHPDQVVEELSDASAAIMRNFPRAVARVIAMRVSAMRVSAMRR
jgi:hypothetical protein